VLWLHTQCDNASLSYCDIIYNVVDFVMGGGDGGRRSSGWNHQFVFGVQWALRL